MVEEYHDAAHFYSCYGGELKCCEESCLKRPRYKIQWFSYNQENKNPLNLVEIYSCRDPTHFYDFVKEVSNEFGAPERVLGLNRFNGEIGFEEKPRFLDLLCSSLHVKDPTPEMLRPIILIGDPSKKQLEFLLQ